MSINLISAKSKAGLMKAELEDTIQDTDIVFLHESGEEKLRTHKKDFYFVPSNGTDGQILVSEDGRGKWKDPKDLNLCNCNPDANVPPIDNPVEEPCNSACNFGDTNLSYGVEWQPDVADPALTRVGNMEWHKTLPIQSGMKGCIYNPKTKEVVYWLDEDDWKYKKGGNPSKGQTESLANLDGTDGEVMVYVPEFWIKSCDTEETRCVRIAPSKIDDTWEYQPAIFVSAYHDTVLNAVPSDKGYLSTLPVNSAVSVANNATYCRGGKNSTTYDTDIDVFKRNLGKGRSYLTRSTFRTYARQTGKELISYKQYKNIIYWLYVIEYANFNSQLDYISGPTIEGFHQGGLGIGISNVGGIFGEPFYGDNCPICPNGYTNEIGNRTGKKVIAPLGPTTAGTHQEVGGQYAIRYRGIENPFGDYGTVIDGIIVRKLEDEVEFYITDNPELYSDTDFQSMKLTSVHRSFNFSAGGITEWELCTHAGFIPRKLGDVNLTVTTFKCDYYEALWIGGNQPDYEGLIIPVLGGWASGNLANGLGCWRLNYHNDEVLPATYRTVCVA